MQMAGRMLFDTSAETLAQFFRPLRNVRKALQAARAIQSCADGKYGRRPPLPQVFQNSQSQLAVASAVHCPWPRTSIQMMRYAAAFESGLCVHTKPRIELRRIARHHFPAELLREGTPSATFPMPSANDGN